MDQTNLALERRKIHHRRPKNRRFWDFGVPLGDPLAALVAVAVMAVLVTVRRKRAGALLIHSNYSNRPGGIPAPLPRSSVHQVRRRPLHSVRQITNDKERNQQKKQQNVKPVIQRKVSSSSVRGNCFCFSAGKCHSSDSTHTKMTTNKLNDQQGPGDFGSVTVDLLDSGLQTSSHFNDVSFSS